MSTTVDEATATMVALISSYADNKGALGRRYGEWAVSAPTVEAAVAAAAMAQDELGHARATYPVLAKLGHPRDEDGLDTSHALPMLRDELPDWASMIAANLVIDGILTTWVAERARQLDRAARPARAQDPPGGRRPQDPRRGVVPSASAASAATTARCCSSGSARRGSRPRAGPGPTTTPATARRSRPACSPTAPPRCARRCASGSRSCCATRDARSSSRSRNGRSDLPVLRLPGHRGRRAVGRPDHHAPGALPQLQHVLRGRPRGLRRPAGAR